MSVPGTITITLNGEARDVAVGTTVRGLIEIQGLAKAACAAEVNRELVPKREHDARVLRDGDAVELVSLVGGG